MDSKYIDLQTEKLKELVEFVYINSKFYKQAFEQNGLTPFSITSIADLSKIPFTTKEDLQRFNMGFLCVDVSHIAEYFTTSGTLGKPVLIALTENDLQRLAYNECTSFQNAGVQSKDIVQLMLTLDRQFMAGIAYYEGIRKLGAAVLRTGPGLAAMQWEMIDRIKPTVLVAVPSFIIKLLEHAELNKIHPNESSVVKIICIGEAIRNNDFDFNKLGKRIVEKWNVQLISTYASTEMQTAFTECTHGKGGHLLPDLLIVEVINEDNNHVQHGESGEIVVTTLGVEGMPLLRYKTGDIATFYDEPCACGKTTIRLGPILGRKQQMIKLKGTTIYPAGIFEIIQQCDSINDFAVEAFHDELGADGIKIHLLSDTQNNEAVSTQLQLLFKSKLRVVPDIRFVGQNELDILLNNTHSRKQQRFIDNRQLHF